ncbi:plasmid mobilization protein [Larkinella terrae]
MKTERKEIRLTEEMLKKMEKRAEQLGLNLSAYIHYCISQELNSSAKS